MNVVLAAINLMMSIIIGAGCLYVAFAFVDRTVMRSKWGTRFLLGALLMATASCALNVSNAAKSLTAGSTPIDRARQAADLELELVTARTGPGPRLLVRQNRDKAFADATATVSSEVVLNVAIAGVLGWSVWFHQLHVIPMMRERKKAEQKAKHETKT